VKLRENHTKTTQKGPKINRRIYYPGKSKTKCHCKRTKK